MSIGKNVAGAAFGKLKNIWDKSAFAGLEKSLGRIKNIISSFQRIAFYRAIRSAIKYVTDALKEGVENAYHYADEFGTATHYIAEAYDRISGSNFTMSNQLGAAWATMIAYIEPIIIRLINLVTRAADAITQFFALLSGKGTYLKAVDYNKKWADSATGAAKAAKEWRNQLMGFDEINRLEEPSDGSGGGGGANAPDYSGMFEEMPVNDFFAEIRKAFENGEWAKLGTLLGEKFNDIVNSIKWAEYGQKIGRGLQASITVAYNFLKTADFKNLGGRLSEFINNAMEQIDFSQLGRLRMRLRTALWDVIYGAVVNLNWSEVATSLSDFMLGELSEFSDWLETLDPVEIANALKDFFGNIKYEEIGEKIKEVVKKAFGLLGDVTGELLPEGLGDDVRDGIVKAIKETDFAALHNVLMYKIDEAVFGPKWADFWWSRGEYAGKDIVMGLIKGTSDEQTNLKTSLDTNLKNPVDQTMTEMDKTTGEKIWSIIDNLKWMATQISLSSLPFGDFLMAGRNAMAGLDLDVHGFGQNIVDNLGAIRQAAVDTWNSLRSGEGISLFGGHLTIGGRAHANGGFVEEGPFYMNSGEIAGRFSNGKTAVANNEMITEGIANAVYGAFMSAFQQTGGSSGNDQPVNIYMDGKLIAQSTTRYQQQFARARG